MMDLLAPARMRRHRRTFATAPCAPLVNTVLPALRHIARTGKRNKAARRPIRIGGRPVEVGVSLGIALGAPQADARSLLARADAAMYGAKRSRRGYAGEHADAAADLPSAAA
jgi:GGDEF domain-containing protein